MLIEIFGPDFFRLITFRAAMAAIFSFLLVIILLPFFIKFTRKKRITEKIGKNDAPQLDSILKTKDDTPTMGGIFIVLSVVISLLVFANLSSPVIYVIIPAMILLSLIGAIDDFVKIKHSPRGLSIFTKLVAQVLVGYFAGISCYLLLRQQDSNVVSRLFLPYVGVIDLGFFFPIYVMLLIVICSNAVNITDGLDGLATGQLTISFFAFAIVCYVVGRIDFSDYLKIPYIKSSAELTVLCTASFGACLGFLWFNSYPAQIFMGDSGSISLGGALGLVAVVTKQEFLLLFVGAIFLIEVFSSFIQIASFKLFRRRIFSIAPLHHSYQYRGMHEVKITTRFLIIQAIFSILALATLKLR